MDGATINMTNIDQPKFCLRTRSPMKGNGNPNFEATTIRGLSQRTCYTVLRMKLGVQKYGMTNDFSDSNVWETRQPAQWRWILTLSNQDMYRYVISLLNRTTFGRMEVNGTEPTQKSVFHSRWHKDIIEPSPRLCAFPRRARLDPWPRQQVVPRRQAALGLRDDVASITAGTQHLPIRKCLVIGGDLSICWRFVENPASHPWGK